MVWSWSDYTIVFEFSEPEIHTPICYFLKTILRYLALMTHVRDINNSRTIFHRQINGKQHLCVLWADLKRNYYDYYLQNDHPLKSMIQQLLKGKKEKRSEYLQTHWYTVLKNYFESSKNESICASLLKSIMELEGI